jgi:hypothetical protein
MMEFVRSKTAGKQGYAWGFENYWYLNNYEKFIS